MAANVISVSAPARLHLGFLDMHGGLGRLFGGIGMALSAPATRISISPSDQTIVEGPDRTRARWHLEAMRSRLGIDQLHHHLVIEETIPHHCGLGSGTQLALAVAAALRTLEGIDLDPEGDAAYLGRGARSGVGAGFFLEGGVLVDGGKGRGDSPPPVIARLPFPAAWRVILAFDPASQGMHGGAETDAFKALPLFPERDAADICRLVLMQALPGLAESDITAFGRAIAEIQIRVGRHFQPAQGGIYSSPRVAAAMQRLTVAGAHGAGQSSWGPTGFAFAASQAEAEALVAQLDGDREGAGLDIRIVEGRNTGATVERHAELANAR
ncbi:MULTISPECIES: beta-ribofuranosylaminobenzene 5'-phosphate synthase family protein [unclassified Aureimonas]|uniref:beta-ribofuranosylaminobenzene 5'-phosphate synthase family protein n=1 Tax=unclassified Aureimonas TaxID=2615206 RepID=UPI0006F46482|nr:MULTISPECIES: beta-ribofuranosylaminobenzene 5'-phosphate synthase family protein [unclassified Aureimonas]KQT69988.1 GHMP kinase [Aureimonas sp. Leaf427]KQT75856.1 GHMP kinase [Aureimonas sp. Leaf460]